MYKVGFSLTILILFFFQLVNAQQVEEPIIDTLSYENIRSIWAKDYEKYKNELFQLHIKKAKKEKDTLQWAHAYRMYAWRLDFENALKYLDTAFILASKVESYDKIQYNKFLRLTHYTLSAVYYSNEYNVEAAREIIKTYNLAKKDDDYIIQVNTMLALADIKANFGQEKESVGLAKKSLNFLNENKHKFSDFEEYRLTALDQLGRCYVFAKQNDSAKKYIEKALKIVKETNSESAYVDLVVLYSKLEFYEGHFNKTRDTILKYINYFDQYLEDTSTTGKADDLYYLGEVEGKLGNSDRKKYYFKRVDSILKEKHYPLIDNVNTIYQFLLQDAIQDNDTVLEKEYFNRLVYYDTLLANTQERLRAITLYEFDLPIEAEEKNALAQVIQTKKTWLNLFYVLSALLLLGGFAYYFKYRNTKKKLALALNHPVTVSSYSTPNDKILSDSKLNEEVLSTILSKLENWENENGFLDSTINQQSLAKQLDTNSTYLSQAINLYKGQNFSSYVKDLRITHAINALKENPELAKSKSMIQLAELFGFNSLSVFNKAFKVKLGITPGLFIKQLLMG